MNNVTNNKNAATIIGLGPMGQAMATVYLNEGYRVNVWNRTASRTERIVEKGAIKANTVVDALGASKFVILSLTDYRAMYTIFAGAEDALRDRLIVNLSSDTPDKTRESATWLKSHGAELLVGGIMVPAELVGKEGAYVFYSGPKAAFDTHEASLRLIGRADYVGEDPGLAQFYYQAQLDIFLTSLAAYLHATALVGSAGVSAKTFLPYAMKTFESMSVIGALAEAADHIDSGKYPDDMANVIMMGATADHIVRASQTAGINTVLPEAVKTLYDHTIAAGRGKDGWPSLFEAIKKNS